MNTSELQQYKRIILRKIKDTDPTLHEQIFKVMYNKNPNIKYSENGKEVLICTEYITDDMYKEIDQLITIYFQNKEYQQQINKLKFQR